MNFHRNIFFVLIVCLAGFGVAAQAQAGGALHGTVIQLSGSPIPQANVTVESTAGGQAATTNQDGHYSIKGLNSGSYKIKIEAQGFEPFEVTILVQDGEDKEADAVLMVAPPPPPEPVAAPQAPPTAGEAPAAAAAPAAQVSVQKGSAGLTGTVTDPTGAVIAGATVILTSGNAKKTVTTNDRGVYSITGIAPGAYKLSVTAPNFAPFETDVTLAGGQVLEIPAGLIPPSAVEKVEVTAGGAATVETGTAEVAGTITEHEVLATGLNGRNFTQLIALAPGVSNQTGQDEAKVGVQGSVKYSVNGGRVEYNNFVVDGSDVLNAGLNGSESTLMVYPSLDAIKEVKVLTSNYGAQYGRTASGTILVTTKSGTEKLHGGAYDFLRNEAFNARNYFDPSGKPPLYRRQDFGFTLGGPAFIPGFFNSSKKKAFFFWSEEFRLEKSPLGPGNEPGDFNTAVPTVAERSGDFSDVCPFVFPQNTTSFSRIAYPDCPAASATGAQLTTYVGNLLGLTSTSPNLPANLDQNSQIIMNSLIPLPNSSNGCNSSLANQVDPLTGQPFVPCYVAAVSPSTYWREELGRFDYNFTEKLGVAFRYIHDSWNTTTTNPQWSYFQTAAVHSQSFPTVENKLDGPGVSLVARFTAQLSSKMFNEFVASYVDSHITLNDVSGPGGNVDATLPNGRLCGAGCINSIFPNPGTKLPALIVGGTNPEYGGNGFAVDTSFVPWEHTNPTYSISDTLTVAVGGHTFNVGIQAVDARRGETNNAIGSATGDVQGILGFTNLNTNGSGNAFADFLGDIQAGHGGVTGPQPYSFQQDSGQLKYYNDYYIVEPYVQDDWRVNSRLTVNLGVRFSLFTNYSEKYHNAWNWDPSKFSQSLAATASIAPANPFQGGGFLLVNGNPIPISSIPLNGNSVVTNGLVQCGVNGVPASCSSSHIFNPAPRIGFAWDPKGDGKTSIRAGYGLFYEHGTPKEANTGSLQGGPPLVLTMTQTNPESYLGIGLGNAYPIDVTSIPTKTVWSNAQQWSLSVERQLPKDMVATIGYVGSKGTHLSAELQLNQLPIPPTGPDIGILPTGNPYGPGQPITSVDCASYQSGPNFVVGNITVTPAQPAWRNLAAACYTLAPQVQPPSSLRTYAPGLGRVLSLQNVADSQYHALQATLRRTRGPVTIGLSYTYSHSLDDSSDRSDASFVNSANVRYGWASSGFDQRHLLSLNYIYDLPKMSGFLDRALNQAAAGSKPTAQSSSAFFRALMDGWEFSGITSFQSGTPFTIINGGGDDGISVPDNAGVANLAGAGSYPDLVGNPRSKAPVWVNGTDSVGPLLFNPAAFAAPQGLTFGNAGRNLLNNPDRTNFDFSLFKNFRITEGNRLEFRIEAFNVFNHTEFRIFNPNIGNTASNTVNCYGGPGYTAAGGLTVAPGAKVGDPLVNVDCTTGSGFLHPVDAHRPRTLQLGLKYSF